MMWIGEAHTFFHKVLSNTVEKTTHATVLEIVSNATYILSKQQIDKGFVVRCSFHDFFKKNSCDQKLSATSPSVHRLSKFPGRRASSGRRLAYIQR
jgi:hypothetical protein